MAFRGMFLRELRGYLITPVAWLFAVIFLLSAGAFTFYLGAFFERGQADLDPFFRFHPWLYLVLVKRKNGSRWAWPRDRKVTRVNSKHPFISESVVCR